MKKSLTGLLILTMAVLSAADDIPVTSWRILGPFFDGIRELDIDHLTAFGGEEGIIPHDSQVFHSIQPDGGLLKWQDLTVQGSIVKVNYSNVNWDLMEKLYGSARNSDEFMNIGYAYAEVTVPFETRVLLYLQNIKTVWVNGLRQEGEYYTYSYDGVPAILKKGKNTILLKFRGMENPWFGCRVQSVAGEMSILEDFTIPDLVKGSLLKESWIGVPLVNNTNRWLRGLMCVIQADGVLGRSEVQVPPIAPLSIMKIPVPLRQTGAGDPGAREHRLSLSINDGGRVIATATIPLRYKKMNQPHKVTYRSVIDGSAQYIGIRYPRNYTPSRKYALILSLHGSGDEGLLMAEVHDAKDWAFVAAPTDRRPWGLEYHAWGNLELQEVIGWMRDHFQIDDDRLYITGASMGGHGSLYQGLLFPARFAGVAPEACFPSPLLYYSSLLQKSSVVSAPGIRYMVDRSLADRHCIYFAENGLHLPIVLTHGSLDDNVPPFNPRFFVERMRDIGNDIVYREVPGRPHFWFEPRTEEGQGPIWGVCVDHPDIWNFLETKKRIAFPRKVTFRCIDLSANDEYYWIRVLEQDRSFDWTEVQAEFDGRRIVIWSNNANVLELHLPKEFIGGDETDIIWNGCSYHETIPADRRVKIGTPSPGPLKKTPMLSGPLRNAFYRPFLLVYGTQGTARETEILLNNARYFAKRFWNWVNGFTRIVSDREITDEMIREYNLILFGSPARNSVSARISPSLPIKISEGRVVFDGRILENRDLALGFVYPNPLNQGRLMAMFAGTTPEMEEICPKIQPIDRRISMPDFVIAGREFDRDGWGGAHILGFFSPVWDLKNRDFYQAAGLH